MLRRLLLLRQQVCLPLAHPPPPPSLITAVRQLCLGGRQPFHCSGTPFYPVVPLRVLRPLCLTHPVDSTGSTSLWYLAPRCPEPVCANGSLSLCSLGRAYSSLLQTAAILFLPVLPVCLPASVALKPNGLTQSPVFASVSLLPLSSRSVRTLLLFFFNRHTSPHSAIGRILWLQTRGTFRVDLAVCSGGCRRCRCHPRINVHLSAKTESKSLLKMCAVSKMTKSSG